MAVKNSSPRKDSSPRRDKSSLIMTAFKNVHSISKKFDLRSQRHHQNALGFLLSTSPKIEFPDLDVSGMPCSWTKYKESNLSKNVILYCHGGGYSTGNLQYCRILSSKFLKATGLSVFSFDYPLTPENPYPAQLNAAVDAWNYLLSIGYKAENIIVAGESAGGHLTLSLALRLKTTDRPLPAALILLSPWTDLTSSGESYTTVQNDPMITLEYIQSITSYFAPEEKDLTNPEISPLFGDFTGFPPTLIHVGECEIIYSDSYDLYKKMTSQGVRCRFKSYPEMWHIFHSFPITSAGKAFYDISKFTYNIW